MNWVDTQLLVYAAVPAHPAKAIVEHELRQGSWGSSVLVLLELYHSLVRDYGVFPNQAAQVTGHLARSPMHWVTLDAGGAEACVAGRALHGLDTADVALLLLAHEDRGTLVSQDRRLLRVAQALGLAVRNPITFDVAQAVDEWERQHLPARRVARVLSTVERWLSARDARTADDFLEATNRLTSLP